MKDYLEKLFKDFVFAKSNQNNIFYNKIKSKLKRDFNRHDLPGGEKILTSSKLLRVRISLIFQKAITGT